MAVGKEENCLTLSDLWSPGLVTPFVLVTNGSGAFLCSVFSLQSWFKLLRFFVRLSVHTDGLESDIEMSNTVISLGPSYVFGVWLQVGWEYLLSWTCGKTALATCRSLTWRWWEWISGWEYVILHRSDQSTVIFSTWWDISTSQWGPRLASSCARNSSAWFIPTAAKFLD